MIDSYATDKVAITMVDHLLVRLEPPTDGRLPVLLDRNDGNLSFFASPSADDSLGDLVRALIRIMSPGTVHASVQWNAEPVEYEFRFDGDAKQTTLTVSQWPNQRRLLEKGKTVFTVKGSREEIVLPFWRALRELEDHSSESWDWSSPFPASDMRELSELVRGGEKG